MAANPSASQPWRKRPRETSGVLEFETQAKPSLKSLEADYQHQIQSCHHRLQQDLDLLHDQVHREIYEALTQELAAVARSIATMRSEASEELRATFLRDVAPLRAGLVQLQGEVQKLQDIRMKEATDVLGTVEAVRRESEHTAGELREALGHLGEAVSKSECGFKNEIGSLRAEFSARDDQLQEKFAKKLQEVDQDDQGQENLAKKLQELESDVVERLDAEMQEREKLAAVTENLVADRDESTAALRRSNIALDQLRATLQTDAAAAETRHREAVQATGTAIAELESRLCEASRRAERLESAFEGKVHAISGVAADRHGMLEEQVAQLQSIVDDRLVPTERAIEQLSEECREGLGFANAFWARTIEWAAEVPLEQLECDSAFDVKSPVFSAAGLRGLQLRLRIATASPGKHAPLDAAGGGSGPDTSAGKRWMCGVFLQASEGQVSFRLHIGSRAQTFSAVFTDAPEWGSQRVATVNKFEKPKVAGGNPLLPIKLEILDVVVRTALGREPKTPDPPQGLTASAQIVDAALAASKEASAIRSGAVRKVEWRVAHIPERINRARKAVEDRVTDEEALEPICSPPFSAAGIDGMQFQLYPMGYRSRGDGQCGFFLVCPSGVSVKCRAWVGDAFRTFEHQYDEHGPYGRGSFCRLEDKVDADGVVVCGVEFLEVRQEHTMQVRGGAFGNIADQLKVTMNPNTGSMDLVRELRELHDGVPRDSVMHKDHQVSKRHRATRAAQDWPNAAPTAMALASSRPAATQLPCALAASKSLPALVPASQAGSAFGGPVWPAVAAPRNVKAPLPKI